MRLFLLLVLLMGFGSGFASTGARADGYAPQAYKPHRHHAQRAYHHRHRHHVATLPGVLGMERAGVLYWRPAVEPMPEFLFDEAEPAYVHGRHTVSARY
ncbi:MAG: hypothetical protein O9972_22020 [Burkholderiales bacterium]|nr:hypothetical protein [Burkholderiales bacterium]